MTNRLLSVAFTVLIGISSNAMASEKEQLIGTLNQVSSRIASILRDYDNAVSEKCHHQASLETLQNASADPAFNDMLFAGTTGQDVAYRQARGQVRCS